MLHAQQQPASPARPPPPFTQLLLTGALMATPAAPTLTTDEDAAAAVAGAAAGSGGTRGHLSVQRTMLEAEGAAPDAPRPVSEGLPLIEAQASFTPPVFTRPTLYGEMRRTCGRGVPPSHLHMRRLHVRRLLFRPGIPHSLHGPP
jgi:hypothetical protein